MGQVLFRLNFKKLGKVIKELNQKYNTKNIQIRKTKTQCDNYVDKFCSFFVCSLVVE